MKKLLIMEKDRLASKVWWIYLLITGVVAAIVITAPSLVIFGFFALILPGIFMMLAPSIFIYGCLGVAFYFMFYKTTKRPKILAFATILILGIGSSLYCNEFVIKKKIDELIKDDKDVSQPIPLGSNITFISLKQETFCTDVCKNLLTNHAVNEVGLIKAQFEKNRHLSSYSTIIFYRENKGECNTDISKPIAQLADVCLARRTGTLQEANIIVSNDFDTVYTLPFYRRNFYDIFTTPRIIANRLSVYKNTNSVPQIAFQKTEIKTSFLLYPLMYGPIITAGESWHAYTGFYTRNKIINNFEKPGTISLERILGEMVQTNQQIEESRNKKYIWSALKDQSGETDELQAKFQVYFVAIALSQNPYLSADDIEIVSLAIKDPRIIDFQYLATYVSKTFYVPSQIVNAMKERIAQKTPEQTETISQITQALNGTMYKQVK